MMIIWLVALAAMILYRARIVSFHDGFLERDATESVKGIFIFIVLLSHARGYVLQGDGALDLLYASFFEHIGQLMVAMFLCYSGYGCYESFKKKENYLDGFLKKRVLKTLFNFDTALLLYVAVNLAFQIHFPVKSYLLCWIGWEDIGNSNWYIFAILVLYCTAWIGFTLEKKTGAALSIPVVSILSAAYICFMHGAGKESWWYDTALCFPFGMMVSRFKDLLCRRIARPAEGLAWLAAALVAFLAAYLTGGVVYFICTCLFCLVILLVTARIRIVNEPLVWMGRHLFEIYILQRIPMIILSQLSVREPMLFTALSIAGTMALAAVFHRLILPLNAMVFSQGNSKRA